MAEREVREQIPLWMAHVHADPSFGLAVMRMMRDDDSDRLFDEVVEALACIRDTYGLTPDQMNEAINKRVDDLNSQGQALNA